MLDADRDADGGVRHAEPVASLLRHPRMRGRGRMANERLRAAEADGKLEDLQRIEHAKGLRLTAGHVEREGGARRLALRLVGPPRRRSAVEIGEMVDLGYSRMAFEKFRDDLGIAACSPHAQAERFER